MVKYTMDGTGDSGLWPNGDLVGLDWVLTVVPTNLYPLVILVHNDTAYLPNTDIFLKG